MTKPGLFSKLREIQSEKAEPQEPGLSRAQLAVMAIQVGGPRNAVPPEIPQGSQIEDSMPPGVLLALMAKSPPELTPERQMLLLDSLVQVPNLARAAMTAGVLVRTARNLMASNEMFRSAVEMAIEVSGSTLEAEAFRRAIDGVKKGIYFRGELASTEIEYSNDLLKLALSANVDRYEKKVNVSGQMDLNLNWDDLLRISKENNPGT